MKKVLFIAPHRRDRSPSQRFRFEQYMSFLEENGWKCELSHIISESDDKKFYAPGNYFFKLRVFIKSWLQRRKDGKRAKDFDIVFVQREAFMTGSIRFEKMLKKSGAKMIFDFDDSIWLSNVSDANKRLNWLKDPDKTGKIIAISDMVFAGNDYLKTYAEKFNQNVKLVPTTVNTQRHTFKEKKSDTVVIGWTGSITTIQHFELAVPFLEKLKAKFGDKVSFHVIGDPSYRNEKLGIEGIRWTAADEVERLQEFDIGIMPLPSDEWAKGKCGLKGLQYMALSLPTIMSPVGVNSAIISDGVNGFLADSHSEWEEKLSLLIEDETLRAKLGAAGRETIEERYSVEANKHKYLAHFRELIGES